MNRQHHYSMQLEWTGNTGEGTSHYRAYKRDFVVSAENKAELPGSSDPSFRGDPTRYNPEELFVASLSSCHMLWYLHLCSDAGIVVEKYSDRAMGIMQEDDERGGFFREVTLHPDVVISDSSKHQEAMNLHERAHKLCFIANSCNFPVKHKPTISAS